MMLRCTLLLNPLIIIGGLIAVVAAKPGGLSIIGGHVTNIVTRPYQVSISLDERFACSGAILNKKWIITVASCIYGIFPQDLEIRAGSAERNSGGETRQVKRAIIHSDFGKSLSNDGDIALLELEEPLIFRNKIKPIRLAVDPVNIKYKLFVSGWGKDEFGNEGKLKKLQVQLIDREECQNIYKDDVITTRMLCTGNGSDEGPDWDDFGDPLKNEWNALIGLYSWSRSWSNGKHDTYPAVYTYVNEYKSWIEQHINDTD